jgi:hypothetical protein
MSASVAQALWSPALLPPAAWAGRRATRVAAVWAAEDAVDLDPGDAGFIALCAAYRGSGGIARGADLAHWMAGRGEGDSLSLAALIVGRQAFSFDWHGTFWVPMFQFSPQQPAWGVGARQVLAELAPLLEGWQLAAWFVRANTWLSGQRPLDLLADQRDRVLAAARTDRYVING